MSPSMPVSDIFKKTNEYFMNINMSGNLSTTIGGVTLTDTSFNYYSNPNHAPVQSGPNGKEVLQNITGRIAERSGRYHSQPKQTKPYGNICIEVFADLCRNEQDIVDECNILSQNEIENGNHVQFFTHGYWRWWLQWILYRVQGHNVFPTAQF